MHAMAMIGLVFGMSMGANGGTAALDVDADPDELDHLGLCLSYGDCDGTTEGTNTSPADAVAFDGMLARARID